ncbi:MAG: histidinol-phosphate aminotransferase family protein [Methanosarcinales archaeon]|nr:histidinol-phosphate aminotransferase family protein [Methanosarcinales archaeon]
MQNCTPCMHGGRIVEYADRSMLDFSANLNPMGVPDIPAAVKEITHYPDNNYLRLRTVFADFVERYSKGENRITAANVIPANGSSEFIRLFAEAVIERGDLAIIAAPAFDEYAFQCRLFGAEVQYCDYSRILELPSDQISDASVVFLCNPNNPTGGLITQSDVKRLAERCSSHETFLFVDEAFIELSDPVESIVHSVFDSEFVVVLRSLTKVFAVPGLRLGFGIASSELAELLNRARLVWNIGAPAEMIGTHLMEACMKSDYLERSIALIAKERRYLMKELVDRGFIPYKSNVNFILIDISNSNMDSHTMTQKMIDHGILVRDCATFRNLDERYIRVAVRTRAENQRLVQAFDAVVG